MRKLLIAVLSSVLAASAVAKLPPPSDEAKAKAAEAAAKTAHGGKVEAYLLCRSMEKVAARYQADAAKAGQARREFGSQGGLADNGMARLKLDALLEQAIDLPMRTQGHHLIALRMATNDVQGIDPDRPGRSEDRQALHGAARIHGKVTSQTRATSGSVEVRLSIRSRTPPCPGKTLLLSFRPAWRLSKDSKRSPTTLIEVRATSTTSSRNGFSASATGSFDDNRKPYARTAMPPPTAPSQVFPGLILGPACVSRNGDRQSRHQCPPARRRP